MIGRLKNKIKKYVKKLSIVGLFGIGFLIGDWFAVKRCNIRFDKYKELVQLGEVLEGRVHPDVVL